MELLLFSWDDDKDKINQKKHGVSFDIAKLVFDDAFHLTRQDRIENGEEHIRIISARRTSKLERKIYEQGTWVYP